MIDQLSKTIQYLKDRVITNLKQIKENEKRIKSLLNNPDAANKNDLLKSCLDDNKQLLNENNESLKIQFALIDYIRNHRKKIEPQGSAVNENALIHEKDYFDLTVSGVIPFDQNHPKFHDPLFFDKLMEHFQQEENYEMCGYLREVKK